MTMKRCKQCGDTKTLASFRPYYNRNSGTYTICLECEKINSRYKYLRKKAKPSAEDQAELANIEALYDTQRQHGLMPPRSRAQASTQALVEAMTQKLSQVATCNVVIPDSTPFALSRWLTEDLTPYTPDELSAQYDKLREKYKPVIGLDASLKPKYDTTYESVLNAICDRFDDYEDHYYK